jgi:hypothetical protein
MRIFRLFDLGAKRDRLHWAVRVEGKNGPGAEDRDPTVRTHLRFLLGKYGVTAGAKAQFTVFQICAEIEKEWARDHGEALVEPYHPDLECLECFLKSPGGKEAQGFEDTVEISPALHAYLKRKRFLADYSDRDPFALDLILAMRRHGTCSWFGDEDPDQRRIKGSAPIRNDSGRLLGYRKVLRGQTNFYNRHAQLVAKEIPGKTYDEHGTLIGDGNLGRMMLGDDVQRMDLN